MMHILLKSIILLWPFLKRAIFGDRPIKDFLLVHKQFSIVFAMAILLSVLLIFISREYHLLKNENVKLKDNKENVIKSSTEVNIDDRKNSLDSLLN